MMNVLRRFGSYVLLCALGFLANSHQLISQAGAPATDLGQEQVRDGQHDFDFLFGTWRFHLKRRVNPLSGSNTWVEFDGTAVSQKVWDGRANEDVLELDGPSGHIEGLTLRLYNPQSRQWSLYWANGKAGTIGGPPNVGEFKNGQGVFLSQDTYKGRLVLVRYIWSDITPNSAHFEQSYSNDGGKNWEANWITDQTRVPDESVEANRAPTVEQVDSGTAGKTSAERDGQHDFDFNFGTWETHIKRLTSPLTGSTTWSDLNGTVRVRNLLNGRAQLEEIEADGPNGHWEGLTLFLYNPQSHQWSQSYANRDDGVLNAPSIGEFKNGRGELFDQEIFNGRAILARFVWSDITPNSHHVEQSFSDDGGKTWEPNFTATLTRVAQ